MTEPAMTDPAMKNKTPLIRVRDMHKTYDDGASRVEVLRGLDLEIARGERVAVVGSSGSGKSTLLHLIGALDNPSQGSVTIDDQNIHKLSIARQGTFRNRNLGFVYQFHHLLPEFTALENVAMPLVIRGEKMEVAKKKAAALIERVGLTPRQEHKPGELSGGERQRIAFSRALVTEPLCVLADEPTGNLDHTTAERVYDLMLDLNREFGTSFITVTHDYQLAAKMDRALKLEDGVLSPL